MTHHVPLDNVDHADLRVAIRHGAAFGDAVNQLLVMPGEFEELQREFPILFRRGGDADAPWYAVVLTGFDQDENLFLADGGWTTRAVP
ncbi:MAG: SapC family protein, partial [Xanthomonas perforans]|nr:SapC family protein [Xanthomonas perforans]NEL74109.1 SapC family protein [Xanthomonas perforans]